MQNLKTSYSKIGGKITKEVFWFVWFYVIQILSLHRIMVKLPRFANHEGIVTHMQKIHIVSYCILVR